MNLKNRIAHFLKAEGFHKKLCGSGFLVMNLKNRIAHIMKAEARLSSAFMKRCGVRII